MRYLVALLFGAATASAQNFQVVHEVAQSTSTITQTVAVTTQTYIDAAAATSTGTVGGYFGIEVYSPAASAATVVCGFDVSLSTLVASAWYGREVPAGIGVYFGVSSNRKLYCQSLSVTAATRVTVTQFK